ncbi:DNA-dependent metalloprotease SPRTN-like [Ptychodera flava]|uniref:DNA-dependent metalloprotease SPRTN-like n=1 Tax=Ptychodera flava TaxID=63121 RepID=UPI003969F40F
MSYDSDAVLARLLQEEFDRESADRLGRSPEPSSSTQSTYDDVRNSKTQPVSIVDERWELIDPNPDIRALFLQFNDRFFWGKLAGIEVKWSPRMTLCAGLCCYEGRGGLCSIRLSLPLLKLRPRKDLVETLLHEMIHALLFVTHNNKDHDSHGPEFHKHMYRINKASGTNISVYHNFHDEVDVYRQHWWKCNGPCQKRPPYFGIVRRAMNRAPSARDPWWGEHQRSCGGSYTKIKEPEGYGQKKGKTKNVNTASTDGTDKKKPGSQDIRDLFSRGRESHSAKGPGKSKETDSDKSSGCDDQEKRPVASFPGSGHTLGGSSSGTSRLLASSDEALPGNKKKPNLKAKKPRPSPISCFSSSSDEENMNFRNPKIRKIDTNSNSDHKDFGLTDIASSNRGKCVTGDRQVLDKTSSQGTSKGILDAFNRQRGQERIGFIATVIDSQSEEDSDDDLILTSVSVNLVKQRDHNNSTKNSVPSQSRHTHDTVKCPVCEQMFTSVNINAHLDSCLTSHL